MPETRESEALIRNMRAMRIAAIIGSLRSQSYNRKLAAIATDILLRQNVEVDLIDLKMLPLPIYDGDVESEKGLPDATWKLKARLAACHGILIVSPEYNGGVPGGLKNAIDWSSRGEGNPWQGKAVALMGASTGMWGTTRMMPHLRQTMTVLGALVIPEQINVPHA
ncbi:NAD(P)H-dependent oxidoreductase, partial [bacterium]|nr:NAD(P)H-dependent oxidoreductase [bacterium]